MASVTLKHLTKTYPNGFISVNDVNLHIDDGEFVIFHGPSGCGKSTILRMIGGLEDITSGETFKAAPLPPFIQEIVRCGGIENFVREKITGKAAK